MFPWVFVLLIIKLCIEVLTGHKKNNNVLYVLNFLMMDYIDKNADPPTEKRSRRFYVPRDECFSEIKQLTFSAKTLYSVLHALSPSLATVMVDRDLGFPYFTAIDSLFSKGVELPSIGSEGFLRSALPRVVKAIKDSGQDVLRFEIPETVNSTQKY